MRTCSARAQLIVYAQWHSPNIGESILLGQASTHQPVMPIWQSSLRSASSSLLVPVKQCATAGEVKVCCLQCQHQHQQPIVNPTSCKARTSQQGRLEGAHKSAAIAYGASNMAHHERFVINQMLAIENAAVSYRIYSEHGLQPSSESQPTVTDATAAFVPCVLRGKFAGKFR